jgi:prepilin signal peptidase PulO-like enzyme (type II secretory pathway)
MIPFFIFVLGAIFGSFLSAVVYRVRLEESFVKGRSRCPNCNHTLAVLDLFPIVSWILLGGKCRYCRKGISWSYPLTEICLGLAFLLAYTASHQPIALNLQLALWLIMTVFLAFIFMYDARYYLILDQTIFAASLVAVVCNVLLGVPWQGMVIGALVGGGFFLAQFVVSRGQWIGGGDIKLGVLMGLLLSWPTILGALFLAYISGSIIGLGLVAGGKKQLGSQVPFGTFLTLSTFVMMLYGQQIISWYLAWFYV